MFPPQFFQNLASCGNRVISAGGKGVAAHDAPYRQQGTGDDSPFHDGIHGVTRTGRRKAAGGRGFERGKETAVQPHGNQPDMPQKHHGARKDTPDAFRKRTVTHWFYAYPTPVRQECRRYWQVRGQPVRS